MAEIKERPRHELERGVVCNKCKRRVKKSDGFKRITTFEPIVADTTGKYITTGKLLLCNDCFELYKSIIASWVNCIPEMDSLYLRLYECDSDTDNTKEVAHRLDTFTKNQYIDDKESEVQV